MVAQLLVLGWVSACRALIELLVGAYVLAVASVWTSGLAESASGGNGTTFTFLSVKTDDRPAPFDRTGIAILGAILVVLAILRFAQSISSLRVKEWARRLGLFLAIVDFVTPLTLLFALWSLVVYRHPDVREHFRAARASGE